MHCTQSDESIISAIRLAKIIITLFSMECTELLIYCWCIVAAEEPVAMDTDHIGVDVTEDSDLTAQPSTSLSCSVAMACSVPSTSVCLLAPESTGHKDSLEDVSLDLAEPFSLGNLNSFGTYRNISIIMHKCAKFASRFLTSLQG